MPEWSSEWSQVVGKKVLHFSMKDFVPVTPDKHIKGSIIPLSTYPVGHRASLCFKLQSLSVYTTISNLLIAGINIVRNLKLGESLSSQLCQPNTLVALD